MTTFDDLRAKLVNTSKGGSTEVEVEPEEILVYFDHWPQCPYTNDLITVVRPHKRRVMIHVYVGDDREPFKVAVEKQNFYAFQREWDRHLRERKPL